MNKPSVGSRTIRGALLALTVTGLLATTLSVPLPADELRQQAQEGGKLTAAEAQHLEGLLRENPDDLAARAQLLGFYLLNPQARAATRTEHVLWMVLNHPDSSLAGSPFCRLHVGIDAGVDRVEAAWLDAVERYADSPRVLANASGFFLLSDRDLALELLEKAQALEPSNAEWSQQLGHLHSLGLQRGSGEARREAAAASLEQYERALSSSDAIDRFYLLGDTASVAFEAGELEMARAYAEELLSEAEVRRPDWNTGNAIHDGNLILGRLALAANDIEGARRHLLAAGTTPGSPQLNSFGPSMLLAQELLERGETEVVLEYFELCSAFWDPADGRLDRWTALVEAGQKPNFGGNLSY